MQKCYEKLKTSSYVILLFWLDRPILKIVIKSSTSPRDPNSFLEPVSRKEMREQQYFFLSLNRFFSLALGVIKFPFPLLNIAQPLLVYWWLVHLSVSIFFLWHQRSKTGVLNKILISCIWQFQGWISFRVGPRSPCPKEFILFYSHRGISLSP